MGYSFKTHLELFIEPISCLVERDGGNSKKENHPFNKLTSVFHASVLLLIMNFVTTLSK